MMRLGALALAGVLLAGPASAQELNLSQDLLPLGIGANMEPNRPDLDSTPLFQAAINYVKQHTVTRVTLDPGDYYFLSTQPVNGRYIFLQSVHDVAFAFPGVNLYFKEPFVGLFALQLVDCERVTLSGFAVDFLELPFTQVRVAQVRPEERTIRFAPMSGYRPATDFNTIRQANATPPEIHGIAFRDGTVVADTGRFSIVRTITDDTVTVAAENYWSDPATLAKILPGDTLVIFGRGDQGNAVRVDGGTNVGFEDVDVYASKSIAVLFVRVGAARLERVRVIPRPGTDRLISSSADGLNFTNTQAGSVMRGNEVRRTLDDGLAINSTFLASVTEAPAANRLVVRRQANTRFENGLDTAIVNTTTAAELAGGRIIAQTPAYEAPVVSAGAVTLDFDRALPAVSRDYGMAFATAAQRGQGTIVENNLVEEVLFARGIYLAGVTGVAVRGNIVRRTASGGIVAWQAMQPGAFSVPPIHDITITGNTVIQPVNFAMPATGAFAALGGISVVSAAGGRFVSGRVNSQITIDGNRISDAGTAGIWITSVAGGSIRNNTISGYGLRPDTPLVGVQQSEQAQLRQEFHQGVVVRSSDSVDTANNTIQ